ncbi:TBC1 domain family member 2A isoform X2 [Latimeria chalumnae]|uniref:TBC1 domain family member 2A isoform X2 n=1 Tax=Latimeria chalumnae TaxID=7897 RepID=UPI0003C13364|nr:PREDICTED: TBC1 domain family member 2A [Latimeria chalumnae]|eukprot:XP_005998477.1 PREDICTED: TBC1 domain family member 2A [Latimeria chalumnae]
MEEESELGQTTPSGVSSESDQASLEDADSITSEEVGVVKEADSDLPQGDLEKLQLKPIKEDVDAPSKKLCGYLHKLGAKGPLKNWKSRWFSYDEKKCQLYYYRTPQDLNHLGSIDFSHATFSYQLEAEEGMFEIKTPSRTFVLKAVNRQTMLYWLQQLQLKRWEYSNRQTTLPFSSPVTFAQNSMEPQTCEADVAQEEPKPQQKSSPSSSWKKDRKPNASHSPLPCDTAVLKRMKSCDGCTRLQQQVLTLRKDLQSQKDLVKLLHKAVETAQQEKRTCNSFLSAPGEEERLEMIQHKVRHIAELDSRIEVLEKEKKELEQNLNLQDAHVEELRQHVQMLMEKNNASQQVILKLSEPFGTSDADPHRSPSTITTEAFHKQQEENEHLKDDLEAYRVQNKFLNSEMHQVTRMWRNSVEQEEHLLRKCAFLEARNCQIESKYLIVLRRLQTTIADLDGDHRELVKRLIQEALQWGVGAGEQQAVTLHPVSEHDAYGFETVPTYEVEDIKLLARIQALEIKSNNLRNEETSEKPLRAKWANTGELTPSVDLKNRIRCGIPVEYRQRVWKWIVNRRVQHMRCPGHYEKLLKKCETATHPSSKQIELDLNRTLINNKHFASPSSEFIQKLRRVLLAFSWQNPTVGYCQGLNRLTAIALLVLLEEEEAFWCLVAIVETIMPPDYYSKTMTDSQVDQRVFQDLLLEKLPRLMAHFKQHSVDLSLITFNWFLVIFVDSLVSDILLRVWDAFLYEGTKVIFRYALALFRYNEEEILKIQDNLEIYQYLRLFTKTVSDGRKLMNIAFTEMNPFPMRQLRNRRMAHLEKFRAELSELEKMQEEYTKHRVNHKDKDLDTGGSEDEEM